MIGRFALLSPFAYVVRICGLLLYSTAPARTGNPPQALLLYGLLCARLLHWCVDAVCFVSLKLPFRVGVWFVAGVCRVGVAGWRGRKCLKERSRERESTKPRGLMDKASAYGAEDCGFKSHRGWSFLRLIIN